MYDALTVAKYVIDREYRNQRPITNLRLQKLLYFIQGYTYKYKNKAMFEDDLFAWKYGPVVPNVYYEYSEYSGVPIRENYSNLNIDNDDENFINDVVDGLLRYSEWDLVKISHEPRAPWNRYNLFQEKIPKEDIKEYFMKI